MEKIDFVIPWVDPTDPKWKREFNIHYKEKSGIDATFERYRDWDLLKFWFRGVEQCAPWVNKVHFITNGHTPRWLNLNYEKLNFIRHEDYIPQQFLPTFSSHPIEIFLHKIKDLSEKFVYFNDDFFLIDKVYPFDFFHKNLPCDISVFNTIPPTGISHILLNNLLQISENFNKKNIISNNVTKWFSLKYKEKLIRNFLLLPWPSFTGFYDHHLPQPFLKETFEEVWSKNNKILIKTAQSKFRSNDDVNQYLFRYWQLCKGTFYPHDYSKYKYFTINENNIDEIVNTIIKKRKKIITINDDHIDDFDNISKKLQNAFNVIFNKKSKFEK
ncbi:glycosyl transferase [Proteus sp. G2667]|uniref:Stealth CR1 domain-containing protein n=1 Tax=Proteus sp. G2667 TaxID=2698880 RepID=UPI0013789BD7|nr:Stealth CR1 domain-containing protein [Proteus sp. G2667]NBM57125.1 glycosyl transferase [Proteus sp. G2667]